MFLSFVNATKRVTLPQHHKKTQIACAWFLIVTRCAISCIMWNREASAPVRYVKDFHVFWWITRGISSAPQRFVTQRIDFDGGIYPRLTKVHFRLGSNFEFQLLSDSALAVYDTLYPAVAAPRSVSLDTLAFFYTFPPFRAMTELSSVSYYSCQAHRAERWSQRAITLCLKPFTVTKRE